MKIILAASQSMAFNWCLRRCLMLRAPASVGLCTAASAREAVASAADLSLLTWQPNKGVTMDQSLRIDDYFQVNRLVNKHQLMEHRVHLGHKFGCRSEWMTPSLFGCRCDVDIIDLEQTAPLLRRALNFTAHVAARGGIVLFVWQGWPALSPLIERRVAEMGEFSYTRPWVDQSLTDATNYFNTATRLPDLAIFLSCMSPVMLPHPAIAACAKVMVPTVGICDSNADPRLVTYPVPGNDDSPQALQLYLVLFGEAIRRGKAAFAQWSTGTQLEESAASTSRQLPDSVSDDYGDDGLIAKDDPRDSFRRAQTRAIKSEGSGTGGVAQRLERWQGQPQQHQRQAKLQQQQQQPDRNRLGAVKRPGSPTGTPKPPTGKI